MSGGTVLVATGEPSGDAHAAAFVAALFEQAPGVAVEAVGGPQLASSGARLIARIEDLSVMGFVEVWRKLPVHWRLLRRIRRRLERGDVRLVVLVDYPGFHLRLARVVRRAGIPVLYYIAPQVWAWGGRRASLLAASVTHLAVILPFEEAFFRSLGVTATFVGHPLTDRQVPAAGRDALRRELRLDPARPVLGLFPGSRPQEVRRHWPLFRDAALRLLDRDPAVQPVLAAAAGVSYPGAARVRTVVGRAQDCLAVSDAALCKSGTTTLEAAIAGTPMVIAYRMHRLSFLIARRLVDVPWVGLVNLVAGREVAPEFIQAAATAGALADALAPLLEPGSERRGAQLEGLAEVRSRLGEPGAARRVAAIARALMAA